MDRLILEGRKLVERGNGDVIKGEKKNIGGLISLFITPFLA
jgi:hypothetical protein